MEISLLSGDALRIKGKKSILLVDVLDTAKTEANAYLFLTQDMLQAKADKKTLLIGAPGDYEVSGIKISTIRSGGALVYSLIIDGIKVLLTSTATFVTMKDKVDETHVVLFFANSTIDQTAITNISPSVVVCYGEKAKEVSKTFLTDAEIKPVDKFSVTAEKLPAEMQVVLLG